MILQTFAVLRLWEILIAMDISGTVSVAKTRKKVRITGATIPTNLCGIIS
jgi:hypothetical protein